MKCKMTGGGRLRKLYRGLAMLLVTSLGLSVGQLSVQAAIAPDVVTGDKPLRGVVYPLGLAEDEQSLKAWQDFANNYLISSDENPPSYMTDDDIEKIVAFDDVVYKIIAEHVEPAASSWTELKYKDLYVDEIPLDWQFGDGFTVNKDPNDDTYHVKTFAKSRLVQEADDPEIVGGLQKKRAMLQQKLHEDLAGRYVEEVKRKIAEEEEKETLSGEVVASEDPNILTAVELRMDGLFTGETLENPEPTADQVRRYKGKLRFSVHQPSLGPDLVPDDYADYGLTYEPVPGFEPEVKGLTLAENKRSLVLNNDAMETNVQPYLRLAQGGYTKPMAPDQLEQALVIAARNAEPLVLPMNFPDNFYYGALQKGLAQTYLVPSAVVLTTVRYIPDMAKVSYAFKSTDSNQPIPDEVKALLPTGSEHPYYETVTPTQPTQTEVTVGETKWTFKGYQKPGKSDQLVTEEDYEVTEATHTFTGYWTPTPVPKQKGTVKYEFAVDPNSPVKELPKEVESLLPDPTTHDYGTEVTPTNPTDKTDKQVKTSVKVEGGTWTFNGYTPEKITVKQPVDTFKGTWTYTADPNETDPAPKPDPDPAPGPKPDPNQPGPKPDPNEPDPAPAPNPDPNKPDPAPGPKPDPDQPGPKPDPNKPDPAPGPKPEPGVKPSQPAVGFKPHRPTDPTVETPKLTCQNCQPKQHLKKQVPATDRIPQTGEHRTNTPAFAMMAILLLAGFEWARYRRQAK